MRSRDAPRGRSASSGVSVRRVRIAAAVALIAAVMLVAVIRRAAPAPAVVLHAIDQLAGQRRICRECAVSRHRWLDRAPRHLSTRWFGTVPAALFVHGGGWVSGSKASAAFWALPFLARGYAVVAVGYRLADVAPAPEAVEDVRCALGWLQANGGGYQIDPSRIVTAGDSAGGHLALMAGLLRGSDGFDTMCDDPVRTRVAAILSIFGVSDVAAPADQQARQPADSWPFALQWLGASAGGAPLAQRVSPLSWIRADSPPVRAVHGTADALVPFAQARALHRALDTAGVRNDLVTIDGGAHGDFSVAQWAHVARRIMAFLPAP